MSESSDNLLFEMVHANSCWIGWVFDDQSSRVSGEASGEIDAYGQAIAKGI